MSLKLIGPQLDKPVFASAIRGAFSCQKRLFFGDQRIGSRGQRTQLITRFPMATDCLLVASFDDDALLRTEHQVPFVVLNRQLPGSPGVVLESRAVTMIAVDHVVKLGYRRIAHLAGRPGGFNAGERLAGYRDGLTIMRADEYCGAHCANAIRMSRCIRSAGVDRAVRGKPDQT